MIVYEPADDAVVKRRYYTRITFAQHWSSPKLDRQSRGAHSLLGLEKASVDFVAVDMPNANRLTVRLMAVLAQEEHEMISVPHQGSVGGCKGARCHTGALSVVLGYCARLRRSIDAGREQAFFRRVANNLAQDRPFKAATDRALAGWKLRPDDSGPALEADLAGLYLIADGTRRGTHD